MFISENLGTILTGLVIAWVVVAVIVKLVRDKQSGRNVQCGSGCKSCSKCVDKKYE